MKRLSALRLHHSATMRHFRRSHQAPARDFSGACRGERTDQHLPEGGNSFHSSEQTKQTVPKFWSPQDIKGHRTLPTFHRSHQRKHTDGTQMKLALLTWLIKDAPTESRKERVQPVYQAACVFTALRLLYYTLWAIFCLINNSGG